MQPQNIISNIISLKLNIVGIHFLLTSIIRLEMNSYGKYLDQVQKSRKGLLCYAIRHVFPTCHSFFKLTFIIVHLSMYLMCTSAITSLFTSTLILSNLFSTLRPEYLQNSYQSLLTILKWHPIILRVDSIPQPGLEGSARWASASTLRDTFMLISTLCSSHPGH